MKQMNFLQPCGIFQDTAEHHISPKTKQKTSYKISKCCHISLKQIFVDLFDPFVGPFVSFLLVFLLILLRFWSLYCCVGVIYKLCCNFLRWKYLKEQDKKEHRERVRGSG